MNLNFKSKDFFGDPLWPTEKQYKNQNQQNTVKQEYASDQECLNCSEQNRLKNYQNNQDPYIFFQNSKEQCDFQNSFLLNEQKMIHSNFKNSQLTYLQDHVDKSISESFNQVKHEYDEYQDKYYSQLNKLNEEHQFLNFRKITQNEILQQNYYQSQDIQNQIVLNNTAKRNIKSFQKKQTQIIKKKIKIKKQQKINKRIHAQKFNIKFKKNYIVTHNHIKNNKYLNDLVKRLNYQRKNLLQVYSSSQESFNDLFDFKTPENNEKILNDKIQNEQFMANQNQIQKQIKDKLLTIQEKDRNKASKYKILTQKQKQFIVYLATKQTTCSIGRKFNISVNNICRWKKSCSRKAGAGRKINNQVLEQNVKEFIKNSIAQGKTLTRKIIQMKAKQYANHNDNFKASKGWFERFYNRNIQIFKKPELTNQKIQQ